MPKNNTKSKGGNKRRKGKSQPSANSRALEFKTEGQEYAQVTKMLGNGRCTCNCFDGKERIGTIRGKMRRRVWVNKDDIVLVGLREFEDDKCDIMLKYSPDDARSLVKQGEISSAHLTTFGNEEDEEDVFAQPKEGEDGYVAPQQSLPFNDDDDDSSEEEDIITEDTIDNI